MNQHALKVLVEVAETLAFLTPIGPAPLPEIDQQEVVVEVGFRGPRCGRIVLALGPALAAQAVANLGGDSGAGVSAGESAIELAKELANVVAGNLLPALYGDDVEFAIDQPTVSATLLSAGDRCVAAAAIELLEGIMAVTVDELVGETGAGEFVANDLPTQRWLPPQFAAIIAVLTPAADELTAAEGAFLASQLAELHEAAGDARTRGLYANLMAAYSGMVASIGHGEVVCDLLRDQLPKLAHEGFWRVCSAERNHS